MVKKDTTGQMEIIHLKILFAIPVLENDRRCLTCQKMVEKLEFQCVLNDIDSRVMLLNGDDSISVKLNRAIGTIKDEDYFCFIHDDMFVNDPYWIKKFIAIYNRPELDCGILGLVGHTDSFVKEVEYDLEQHTFVDGVMFMSADVAKNRFCEDYKYECESHDFSLEMLKQGKKTYKVLIPFEHKQMAACYKRENLHNDRKEDVYKFNLKWKARIGADEWKKVTQ